MKSFKLTDLPPPSMLSSHHKEKRSKPSLDSVAINRLLNPSEENKDDMDDKENLPNAPTTISTTSASVKVSKRTTTKVKPTLQSEVMNFLDENESEEEEIEDEEEEQQLFSMIKKLKEAQSTASISKRRKRNREVMEAAQQQFIQESKQLVTRHNKRWSTKQTELVTKGQRLKDQCQNFQKKMKIETNQYYEQLDKKIRFIQEVQTRLKDIENQFLKSFHENELKIDYETKTMKMELEKKFEDIKQHLLRVYHQSTKDDKLTKLVKTFLTAI